MNKIKKILFLSFIIFISWTFISNADSLPVVGGGSVTVNIKPPTCTISASPLSIAFGDSSSLTWSSANATKCFKDGEEVFLIGNNISIKPLTTTTYLMKCSGPSSPVANCSVSIAVGPQPLGIGVVKDGNGTGVVTSDVGGIDCGDNCEKTYSLGTKVTLTATADDDSSFTGWSGEGCSGIGTCVVTLSKAVTVTATFSAYTLAVTKVGNGTISFTPEGANCGVNCNQYSLSPVKTVTLTGAPASGSHFVSWSPVTTCSGVGIGICEVAMNASKTITATFEADQSDLTAVVNVDENVLTNTETKFSLNVTNDGTGSTGNTFNNKFQVATQADGSDAVDIKSIALNPENILASGETSKIAEGDYPWVNHTFTTAGTYYVRACADSDDNVIESNENNNCSAWSKVNVTSIAFKDLQASPTSSFFNIEVGVPINFYSYIENHGNISIGSSFYNIFQIATGTGGGGTITTIASTPSPMPSLDADEKAITTSSAYTFSSIGTASVSTCADENTSMVGSVEEVTITGLPGTNENNNCSAWVDITIDPAPSYDLKASATTPTSAIVGKLTSFNSTISNIGNQPAIYFYNEFQVATLPNGEGTKSTIGSSYRYFDLNAGSSYLETSDKYKFTKDGTYSVRACADSTDVYSESDETNNCSAWTNVVVSYPNLISSAPAQTDAIRGKPIKFTSIIKNEGEAGTGLVFNNEFQIATSSNGGGTKSSIYSIPSPMQALNPLGSITATSISHTFNSVGIYSVRACADSDDDITEANETDNCSAWVDVNVIPGFVDLSASAPNRNSAQRNKDITLSSIIYNNGNIPTSTSFYNIFKIATGSNGTGTIKTKQSTPFPMTSLGALGSYPTNSVTFQFINNQTYSVQACADSDSDISESDETNNCSAWVDVVVSDTPEVVESNADLTALPPSDSGIIVVGLPTHFGSDILNNGTDSTGNLFYNSFQVATGSSGAGAGPLFASRDMMNTLEAGKSDYATSVDYTFTDAGTYYVRACADLDASWNGNISELNEDNNCSAWTNVSVKDGAIDGACGIKHYACISPGDATNFNSDTTSWSWVCPGFNGGNDSTCSEVSTIIGHCGSEKDTCQGFDTLGSSYLSGSTWFWECKPAIGITTVCQEGRYCRKDAVKNDDEEGVDCGGAYCPSCNKKPIYKEN